MGLLVRGKGGSEEYLFTIFDVILDYSIPKVARFGFNSSETWPRKKPRECNTNSYYHTIEFLPLEFVITRKISTITPKSTRNFGFIAIYRRV